MNIGYPGVLINIGISVNSLERENVPENKIVNADSL